MLKRYKKLNVNHTLVYKFISFKKKNKNIKYIKTYDIL